MANSTVISSGRELSSESEASMASAAGRTFATAASNVSFACSVTRWERSSPHPRVTGPDASSTATRTLPPPASGYSIISAIRASRRLLTGSEESRMRSELATLFSLGKGAVVASVLELDVSGAGTPGTYRVEVLQSPGGEAAATFQLRPVEMLDRLEAFQQAPLASSVPSRGPLSRGQTSVRTVSRRLFLGINDGGPENNRGS